MKTDSHISRVTVTDTILFLTGLYFLISFASVAQKHVKLPSPVAQGQDEKLIYHPDSLGNRIIDFSHCGYMGGDREIPQVPVAVVVPARPGDATLRIQSALDYLATLPKDINGIRGAVLLEKGIHSINGSLLIKNSGVVLRGSGVGINGTTLLGAGVSRETIIRVLGKNDLKATRKVKITDEYVPVNAVTFNVEMASTFKPGDRIQIRRPSTKEWIRDLKMEEFGGETGWLGWKPEQRDIIWDREVKAVSGNVVTIDVPITTALDAHYGGGEVATYQWSGRISHIGIENLTIESTFDQTNAKDEDHRWMGITFENVENAWVRQVHFKHLAGSAVAIYETASKVTVEDCKSTEPISEIGGQRRYTFFTQGQQTLFQRCYAANGYHDFTAGFCAAGPNAFVQCESYLPFSFSGTIDSWASGVLFDNVNVDGNALSIKNRGQDGQGAGWTAANCMLWQCSASRVENFSPPAAKNYGFGIWSQFAGDGYWENVNEHIQPRSLYYAQLSERMGQKAIKRAFLIPKESEASSSPSMEQAAKLAASSHVPITTLAEWIDGAAQRNAIAVTHSNVKTIDEIGVNEPVKPEPLPPLAIKNGWLVRGDQVVTGNRQEVTWWRGSTRSHDVQAAKPHITRFVPGRNGNGLTDDPDEMTDSLLAKNTTVLDHNYGLWYDRRRDDHERTRRMDGEVWPPFYEQPFARSGKDAAWDNLSKYDLTKYNAWYWERLRQFVVLADQKGLILYHQNYFQHNILEAGAHYADFPWRTANNINQTGFPEPPPYAGDKRIFMAEQFYDIQDPVRKALHKAYIRKCLDNFRDQNSVIQFVSAEYTGPLHFVKFWLDVIAEWEKENGKNALAALSTTKDVQDAILNDPDYSKIVDIIDIRYWHSRLDGTTYEPQGGKNLAPRQHARIQKTGKVSFDAIYKSVLEYRRKYPEKAVLYSSDGYDSHGWAVLMAGGSISAVPAVKVKGFLSAASSMKPVTISEHYALADSSKGLIIYQDSSQALNLDLTKWKGIFQLHRIDSKTGAEIGKIETIKAGKILKINAVRDSVTAAPVILWLSKK
ncbi:MAG: DUF6298 domain-containing protein [Dyadobacter sp.]|uniref:DUF6298 domain-containing protein n=1 Tax=Dyadobacter sp. TaxID=1914288 RepID=UPI003265C3C0